MLNNLDDRLARVAEQLRRKRKLEAMLRQAEGVLQDEREKLAPLTQTLAAEEADVEKLEGYGLTALFSTVLGAKESRLEKERQEFLAAKLKYEDCRRAIDGARTEIDRLQNELAGFQQADAEYHRLLEEKEAILGRSGDPRAREIVELAEQLAEAESDRRELQEAVAAGDAALRALEQVRTELHSAENWGAWDMFGGGIMATMTKHSQIDAARRQARAAQQHLRRFQEELADAQQRLHVSLEDISGLTVFADFFIDGLITDWVVQSQIQNALAACSSAIATVTTAFDECRRRLTERETTIEQLRARRNDLIEQS
jgi:chromosome segregation ATPase